MAINAKLYRRLEKKLRETPIGTAEYKKLSRQIEAIKNLNGGNVPK